MDANPRYRKSQAMLARAERVIPLGSQTFSKSRVVYPANAAPLFVTHGKGAHVWDVDGNEYVDFVNGLLPVVLGYDDVDVTAAVIEQLKSGVYARSFPARRWCASARTAATPPAAPCASRARIPAATA